MIELARESFAGLMPALVALPINHLFARAALERCVEGRVWVDDAQNPALVHVLHPYGMTLLFGDTAAVSAQTLAHHLNVQARAPADRWMQVFPANQAARVREAACRPRRPTRIRLRPARIRSNLCAPTFASMWGVLLRVISRGRFPKT